MTQEVAAIVGVAFLITFYYVYTKDLMDKPENTLNRKIWAYLRFKDISVFLHLLGAFLLVGFAGLLILVSAGTTYVDEISVFFTVFAYLVGGFFLAYASVYVIFRIKEELEVFGKLK